MSNFVEFIKEKKRPCIVISPHFDDAVLSCGGLLLALSGKVDLTIVNVFTKAHGGPYTLSARKFLKDSHEDNDAIRLYQSRFEEDREALSKIKVKIINLGLQEALFRKKNKQHFLGNVLPEFDHVYPTYRWHITKTIASNDPAVSQLKKALKDLPSKNEFIFAPYGIGDHADHKVVRQVCEELFPSVILYSDFPYNVRSNEYGFEGEKMISYTLQPDFAQKNKLIQLYRTQFQGLFPDGKVPTHSEKYFVKK